MNDNVVEQVRHRLSRDVVNAYADAAYDHNSIHMSDEAARSLGFDGAIAHGMLTLGWAVTRAGADIAVDGPSSFVAKFSAPVAVGSEITLVASNPAESPRDSETCNLRVLGESDVEVLSVRGTPSNSSETATLESIQPELLTMPLDAEIVAKVDVRVAEHAAIEFARSLGVPPGPCTSAESAREAGFPSVPTVPTFIFALPALGFLAGSSENKGRRRPDPVRDCQEWTRTDKPVIHAGQKFAFTRPILVGESLRARTAVVARREREASGGRHLSFTDVRTVFETRDGKPIAASEMGLVVFG